MYDASDVPCDVLLDDSLFDIPRPATPIPDRSRTLHRTISHASLDTIRPAHRKGVRRRIEEIAEDLKHKSAKKKMKRSGTRDASKPSDDDVASDSKTSPENKAAKRGRKAVSPLRDSHRSEEESVLTIASRLNSGVPSEVDPPPRLPDYKSDSMIDTPLFNEDEGPWGGCSLPVRTLRAGAHVTTEHQDTSPSAPTAKVEDVQLNIQASERDVTIWDGLRAAYHLYKCRLFLRCSIHPYDGASLPDIHRVEMECNTRPVGSAFTRPPVFQAAYEGATPGLVINPDELPKVKLADGIHMNKVWCKMQDDDGAWGWYRDAFVPLSPRLFDKMDYREFRLVSRVWVGESCVEDELTFGISMLLRGLDMSK